MSDPAAEAPERNLNEREVVELARRGNQSAWSEIVTQHQQGVFRMAFLKLADEQEAEEVAQETFVRAFRRLGQFDEERALRPWLLAICVNLCRNRWRALGRYLAAIRRWSREREADAAQASDRSDAGDGELLWSLIRRMKDQDQDILYYRFFMDLTVEEAAEVIGVAPGTIKSRQHRAIERLRGLIQREAPDLLEGLEG